MEIRATDTFRDWYEALDEDTQNAIIDRVEYVARVGPAAKRPYVGNVVDDKFPNLKEIIVNLRDGSRRVAIRVLFAFDPLGDLVLLVGVDKSLHGWDAWYDATGKPVARDEWALYLARREKNGWDQAVVYETDNPDPDVIT